MCVCVCVCVCVSWWMKFGLRVSVVSLYIILCTKIPCLYTSNSSTVDMMDVMSSLNSHMHQSDYNGYTILRTFQTCCSSLPQSRPMGDVATLTNTFPYPRLQKSPALNSCDIHTLQNVP